MHKLIKTAGLTALVALMTTGCMSTGPSLGGSSGNTVTGGSAGGNAANQNTSLERCDETLGTLSIYEDQNEHWWYDYKSKYPNLGSTLPVLRTMVQQSNCFVIVERGKGKSMMDQERKLMQSGELRSGSNFGQGKLVAADFSLQPSIQFNEKDTGGLGGLVGGWTGLLIGGAKSNEAATTLLLVDNRSGVQISSSVGNAKNWDFKAFGIGFLGALVGVGGYSDTPEGKVISAAFADSYNHMVKALRNYKTQQVEGGLGKGGKLKVGS